MLWKGSESSAVISDQLIGEHTVSGVLKAGGAPQCVLRWVGVKDGMNLGSSSSSYLVATFRFRNRNFRNCEMWNGGDASVHVGECFFSLHL